TRMGLRPFVDNLSFTSFDLRGLLRDRPALVRDGLREVVALTGQGVLRPAPLRVFHPSQTRAAMRHLASAAHIGKVVVAMSERDADVTGPLPDAEPGTWLVTGGLGGFGIAAAEHLARTGVRSLVLVGRSGASTPESAARVADLRAQGVDVVVDTVDVSSSDAVTELVDGIGRDLRGVLHCAMVLDDAPLPALTPSRIRDVLLPKVAGAWNLHRATRGLDLAEFVLFSSAASFIGNRGQAHYAAANAFLDHLAHHRRALGLPALAVNWGVISDSGYVARSREVSRLVSATGMEGMTSAAALTELTDLRRGAPAQVGVLPVNWPKFFAHYEFDAEARLRYSDVAASADSEAVEAQESADAPPHEVIAARLAARVATVLGMPVSALDTTRPLMAYLDSLLAVEIVSWIEREVGVKVTIMELMNGPSVDELAARLATAAPIATGR
ncbi:MAG TPA: SDR family NAD(P)-dependent oxidoreductase, partial [Umezawaea sp.]|nr:SDR family NAD(P)-dependent oxidoreductase [Umezawaea sp.]